MSKSKELFVPVLENKVGMYCCGPTVYHYVHVGNLRTYIMSELLRNTLTYLGYEVKYVMNITDVGHLVSDGDDGEDKLEKGARREGKTAWEVAEYYTQAFLADMQALKLTEPSVTCKATDYIGEQIELVRILEEKDYTYIIDDGVYFDTSKLDDYGKLVNLDIEGLKEGARVEFNDQKRNITDFALWKFSPKDAQRDMEWESPWGTGFPGWHAECSAMSMCHLGHAEQLRDAGTFDIHCGGVDLGPVHHTNEIAQSEAATGRQMVKYWVHGEFLILDNDMKMSKSGDNFVTLEVLKEKGIMPLAYKYFTYQAHYRSKLQFNYDALHAAQVALKKLYTFVSEHGNKSGQVVSELKAEFESYISDDMNMPKAIALIWTMLKSDTYSDADKAATILDFDRVLGLDMEHAADYVREVIEDIPEEIMDLAAARWEAKLAKDWAKADALRDELSAAGYEILDSGDSYEVRKV